MGADRQYKRRDGFTLIELSIVLVVIGLVIGGVLVGQNLIKAAEVRATITQIEKYNTAANTFREKYNYLPGDIKDPEASSFGFAARGSFPGEGDGNGIIETNHYGSSTVAYEVGEAVGEPAAQAKHGSRAERVCGEGAASLTGTGSQQRKGIVRDIASVTM